MRTASLTVLKKHLIASGQPNSAKMQMMWWPSRQNSSLQLTGLAALFGMCAIADDVIPLFPSGTKRSGADEPPGRASSRRCGSDFSRAGAATSVALAVTAR